MREIKFRAWDGKRMRGIGKNDWFSLRNDGMLSFGQQGDPSIALMQYTGLKDKNGKEIYEGDILFNEDAFGCHTSWGDATDNFPNHRLIAWDETYAKFDFNFLEANIRNRGCSGFSLCISNAKHFEVVGNIHENPELLAV